MGVDLPIGEFKVALSPFCHEITSRGASKILWPPDAKPTANTKLLINKKKKISANFKKYLILAEFILAQNRFQTVLSLHLP